MVISLESALERGNLHLALDSSDISARKATRKEVRFYEKGI